MTKSIAVIGQGFVGGSLTTVFAERGFDVYTFDIAGKRALGGLATQGVWPGPNQPTDIHEFVLACEGGLSERIYKSGPSYQGHHLNSSGIKNFSNIYFVCLPTPMFDDGECDTSIVEGVLKELSVKPGERIAVIKSTVPPGSVERWNKEFEGTGLRVVFSPEFLTEANALDDMRNQDRIVLGGPRPHINKVKQVFQSAFPKVPIIKTSSTTAEMVKYFTNIQLAARVVLSCEFNQICEKLDARGLDIDYDKVLEYAQYDKRLGGSHMNVPGQDGILGARGHCFPKDLAAIVFLAKQLKIEPLLMEAIQEKNLAIVPSEHRYWEKMVGRAFKKREK